MVLGNTGNEEICIQENLLKLNKKSESLTFEPKPTPSLTFSQLSETETPLQSGAAKNTGLLFPSHPPSPVRRFSSQEGGHDNISHFIPMYLLLRLSSRQVWPRGGGSLLLPSLYSWEGDFTLSRVLLRILDL